MRGYIQVKGESISEQNCIQILPLQPTPIPQVPVYKGGTYIRMISPPSTLWNILGAGLVWGAALSLELIRILLGSSHMQQNLSTATEN